MNGGVCVIVKQSSKLIWCLPQAPGVCEDSDHRTGHWNGQTVLSLSLSSSLQVPFGYHGWDSLWRRDLCNFPGSSQQAALCRSSLTRKSHEPLYRSHLSPHQVTFSLPMLRVLWRNWRIFLQPCTSLHPQATHASFLLVPTRQLSHFLTWNAKYESTRKKSIFSSRLEKSFRA